jgi:hypothetical protein
LEIFAAAGLGGVTVPNVVRISLALVFALLAAFFLWRAVALIRAGWWQRKKRFTGVPGQAIPIRHRGIYVSARRLENRQRVKDTTMRDKSDQLSNLSELEAAIVRAIWEEHGAEGVARLQSLLREVQDRIRELAA